MAKTSLGWIGWLAISPAILVIGLVAIRVAMGGNIIKDLSRLGVEANYRSYELPWMEKSDGTVLFVTRVGEHAAEAGLCVGDIIFEIDSRPVGDENRFQPQRLKETMRLSVRRGEVNRSVQLPYNGLYRKLGAWVSGHLPPARHIIFTESSAMKPPSSIEDYAAGQ